MLDKIRQVLVLDGRDNISKMKCLNFRGNSNNLKFCFVFSIQMSCPIFQVNPFNLFSSSFIFLF